MTRISVLMPVRNGERFLKRALKSTLRALGESDELLVFDDASQDRTAEILDVEVDPRLKVIRVQDQVGIGRGLNILLAHASGRYIARMDADDICLPWRFDRQLSQMKKGNFEILFGAAIYFGLKTPGIPVHLKAMNTKLFVAALTEWCPGIHPTMFAKREVFDSGLRYSEDPQEDYELWLRLALQDWSFSRDSWPILCYRVHSKQVSKSKRHALSLIQNQKIRKLQHELATKIFGLNGVLASESIRSATSDSLLLRLEHLGVRRVLGIDGRPKRDGDMVR